MATSALISPSCLSLLYNPKPHPHCTAISLHPRSQAARSLAFSSNFSASAPFLTGGGLGWAVEKRTVRRSVVCEAAPVKKADSAAKRARQAEKRRVYNKSRKSEIKTRMRKVLEELDGLRKKTEAQAEEILPIEKLIAEAYSTIDKAVKVGTLHRNTGANRKSRLARRKKAVEIHHGWYTPSATAQKLLIMWYQSPSSAPSEFVWCMVSTHKQINVSGGRLCEPLLSERLLQKLKKTVGDENLDNGFDARMKAIEYHIRTMSEAINKLLKFNIRKPSRRTPKPKVSDMEVATMRRILTMTGVARIQAAKHMKSLKKMQIQNF